MRLLRSAAAPGAAVAALLVLMACAGHDRTTSALAQAEWIVEIPEGADPAKARPPAAGSAYGPGSIEIELLRSVAPGLTRSDDTVLWKGHWNAVVGTASGDRLRLKMSWYGGFFVDEDTGQRFSVAPADRAAWARLWDGRRPPPG